MDMKVLHVITGLNDGGAEGVLYRLCANSKLTRHVVISMMDEGKYGPMLESVGVEVHYLGMRPGRISIFGIFSLWRLIHHIKPDVVQTWMYHSDLIGGIVARLAGVRRVFWGVRHSTLDKGKAKRSTIMVAKLCAIISKKVPEKIICCAYKALEVHANLGYVKSKLLVIHNGYDLRIFRPDKLSGYTIRSELSVGESEFLIGNVGRFDPFKDHENLLRALALVKNAGISFRCMLVGKGVTTDNHSLMGLVNKLGLHDVILLVGQRVDIPAIMNSLDLHVLASMSEGFPNVLAEAMACGTLCVTTRVGDALDIVGSLEMTCPPQDPTALSRLILDMHQQWALRPAAWEAHSITCARRIEQRFSIEAMVKAYEDCWLAYR